MSLDRSCLLVAITADCAEGRRGAELPADAGAPVPAFQHTLAAIVAGQPAAGSPARQLAISLRSVRLQFQHASSCSISTCAR